MKTVLQDLLEYLDRVESRGIETVSVAKFRQKVKSKLSKERAIITKAWSDGDVPEEDDAQIESGGQYFDKKFGLDDGPRDESKSCDPLGHNADIIMSGKCSDCQGTQHMW